MILLLVKEEELLKLEEEVEAEVEEEDEVVEEQLLQDYKSQEIMVLLRNRKLLRLKNHH